MQTTMKDEALRLITPSGFTSIDCDDSKGINYWIDRRVLVTEAKYQAKNKRLFEHSDKRGFFLVFTIEQTGQIFEMKVHSISCNQTHATIESIEPFELEQPSLLHDTLHNLLC